MTAYRYALITRVIKFELNYFLLLFSLLLFFFYIPTFLSFYKVLNVYYSMARRSDLFTDQSPVGKVRRCVWHGLGASNVELKSRWFIS